MRREGKKKSLEGEKSGRKVGMKYRQLSGEERSALAALRQVGLKPAEIARELGRHRSTVSRELQRNAASYDGRYRRGGRSSGPTRGVIARGATASSGAGTGSEWKSC